MDWSEASFQLAYCLRGGSQGDLDLYVMLNAGAEDAVFALQEGTPSEWRRVVDTGRPSPDDIVAEHEARPLTSAQYPLRSRSVAVLLRTHGTRAAAARG